MTEQYVTTRAGRVAYTDTGSGRPVVLLHATLHDRHDFDTVLPALAKRHRVIALDWPGHVASDSPPPESVSAPLLADVLEDVVAALAPGPAVFVGNSVGGFAAARLAIRLPEKVAGLVLINQGGFLANTPVTRSFCRLMGTPAFTRRAMPRFISGYLKARTDNDRAIAERAKARARTADGSRTAAALWRSFATDAHDLRGDAGTITAPTLIIWGRKDIAIPIRAGRTAARLIPNARFETLDTGHVAFSSDPDGFLNLVLPFLESVEAGSTPSR